MPLSFVDFWDSFLSITASETWSCQNTKGTKPQPRIGVSCQGLHCVRQAGSACGLWTQLACVQTLTHRIVDLGPRASYFISPIGRRGWVATAKALGIGVTSGWVKAFELHRWTRQTGSLQSMPQCFSSIRLASWLCSPAWPNASSLVNNE